MRSGESLPINNTENNKQFSDMSEASESQTESGYERLDKIDISTNEGKFEWIDGLVDNAIAALEGKQYDILREEGLHSMDRKMREEYLKDNDAYQENKADLAFAKRQSKMLENLDIDGDGGVLGALARKVHYFALAMTNSKASAESMDLAVHNYEAASCLYSTLSSEVVRRDPKYFSQEEMSAVLKSEVEQAKEKVERTMVDEYFGTDGRHIASSGEKMPSPDTEDAEIDLEDANQDVKTFDLLMNDYDDYLRANNYLITQAVKKEDFVPIINKFIDTHTNQLNQLIVKSKTLTKGTPEYAENLAKRIKLARERSSARRLLAKYFNVAKTD